MKSSFSTAHLQNLAKKIGRDGTNVSTFDCTRKLPQLEHALVLFCKTFLYGKHLYIFIEKGKKNFITFHKPCIFRTKHLSNFVEKGKKVFRTFSHTYVFVRNLF